jgi:hypothetical protein
MSKSEAIIKALKKAGKITAGGTALAAGTYGGYQIGKHIGSKRTAHILTDEFKNQQTANDAYNLGLKEGQVEKTAQVIAKELLEKISEPKQDIFETIRQEAYTDELQKLGFNMAPLISGAKQGAKWVAGAAKKGFGATKGALKQGYHVAKANPTAAAAIGGTGLAAGAAGASAVGAMTSKK